MSDKVVDPENARLVAMLRALGEEVPEDLLRKPEATDEEIIAKVSAMTKEEVNEALEKMRRRVSNEYYSKEEVLARTSSNGVKSSGEIWTMEMNIQFEDSDESNEPDYAIPPTRKPKYTIFQGP